MADKKKINMIKSMSKKSAFSPKKSPLKSPKPVKKAKS